MLHNPIERRLRKYSLQKAEMHYLETELRTAKEMLETLDEFQITLDNEVQSKVDERIKKLEQQIADLQKEKELVEKVILELEDDIAREIFKLKYFSNQVWADIAKRVGYTERQCKRIHDDTIEKVISEKLF
jgi:DNA-directed RNA polymerase specialized sigma subunit